MSQWLPILLALPYWFLGRTGADVGIGSEQRFGDRLVLEDPMLHFCRKRRFNANPRKGILE